MTSIVTSLFLWEEVILFCGKSQNLRRKKFLPYILVGQEAVVWPEKAIADKNNVSC